MTVEEIKWSEDGYATYLLQESPAGTDPNSMDFTMVFSFSYEQEEEEVVLYSCKITDTSLLYAEVLSSRLKKELMVPKRLLYFWSKAIADELEFELEPSKGGNHFFQQVANQIETKHLEGFIAGVDFKPFKKVLENELKSRGEYEND